MRKWKKNLKSAAITAFCYLAVFLIGKIINGNPGGLPLSQWLMDASPRNHSYLFGWLIKNGWFLAASLVSTLPSLFGKTRFSLVTLAGFTAGLPFGELLGRNDSGAPFAPSHYGWAIWLFWFLLSCIMGILLECFPKYEITLRARKFRVWLGCYLLAAAAILAWILLGKV